MAKRKAGFRVMSKAELLIYCQELYRQNGISTFTFKALGKHRSLYWALYKEGLTQGRLLDALDLKEEYRAFKDAQPIVRANGVTKRWTWTRIAEIAKTVAAKEGFLPPAGWFQANGYGSLVTALYKSGRSWDHLQQELGDFSKSAFVESRNGMRWRSHPEASLSNFLYARGIEHKRGERYPDEYGKQSSSRYGYFDLHFRSDSGAWIDVEVWGDKPLGHNEHNYSLRRSEKENFNRGNTRFLGIQYEDCFKEERLTDILKSHVSARSAFQFDKPADALIPTTHWSNADELLSYCRTLAASMPNGEFPTEEWLRKRGKYANRNGPSHNTLSIYIKTWLGGIRNLRRLLGQASVSTQKWDFDSALERYKASYEKYALTPDQMRHSRRTEECPFAEETMKEATRIAFATNKYLGGAAEANRLLGIDVVRRRKWSREKIISGFRDVIEKWGETPHQTLNASRKGRVSISLEDQRRLSQLVDAANREFGGCKAVMSHINLSQR